MKKIINFVVSERNNLNNLKISKMEISKIVTSILDEMGGSAEDICCGDCTTFAKKIIDRIGFGQIVSNLESAMLHELEGYEIIEPEAHFICPDRDPMFSHCWVKVNGMFYDPFNVEGVEDEYYLDWVNTII